MPALTSLRNFVVCSGRPTGEGFDLFATLATAVDDDAAACSAPRFLPEVRTEPRLLPEDAREIFPGLGGLANGTLEPCPLLGDETMLPRSKLLEEVAATSTKLGTVRYTRGRARAAPAAL